MALRSVSLQLFTILNGGEFAPVELLEIRLAGSAGPVVRLTNGGEACVFLGNNFQPILFSVGRADLRIVTGTGEVPSVQISISNVDRQLAAPLNEHDLAGATVTVWRTDRRLLPASREKLADLVTEGEIQSPQLNNRVLTFNVVHTLGQLDLLEIPRRLYTKNCAYVFGSRSCGADLSASPNTISATCQTGTTASYIVVPSAVLTAAGSPADPTDYWLNGYVWVVGGVASLQQAPIQRYELVGSQRRFYLRYSLLKTPAAGDAVKIRRGCPKSPAACIDRQGNADNYGGFPMAPYGRIRPREAVHY